MAWGIKVSSSSGSSPLQSDCAERLGEFDEVGIVQVRLVGSAKHLILVAGDVAVGVVSEDDGYHVDAHFTAVESSDELNMNPPSPVMHTTGLSGLPPLHPVPSGMNSPH